MSTKSAARLLELFQGRTSEFAVGRAENDDRGRLKIAYRPSGHPLTVEDLEAHMDGSGPVVGVYLLREDSHCKFASFDIDQQDLLAAEKLRGIAMDLGFPESAMMLVDSGNKGYHLHLFFAEWTPGNQVRQLMLRILAGAAMHERRGPSDADGVEVFPKQDGLTPPGEGGHITYGNLIKLPLVVHPASGRLAGIINARRVVPAAREAVEAVVGPQGAPGVTKAALAPVSAPLAISLTPEGPGTAVVTEGGRNATLTSWAGKLRRDGAAGPAIEQVLLELNQKLCSPPLPEREVRAIARSVSRYLAGEGDMALKPPLRVAASSEEDVPGIERRGKDGRVVIIKMGQYNADQERTGMDWLIEQWLVRGQITVSVGQEKLGKSTQAWHRVAAISAGEPYWGGMAVHKGRCLVMTEMTPETVQTLLDEDDIYPEWENVDLLTLDLYEARERLTILREALEGQGYAYCMLDPIDECIGLDAEGIWNSATSSAGFDALRDMIRQNGGTLCIEGLYHFNKAGKVANSYKFASKPDTVYEIKGDSPAEVTIRARCRTRAIPKARKLSGEGAQGYEVTLLEAMPTGRPSKRQAEVGAWMQDKGELTAQAVAEGVGIKLEAARQALRRMVAGGSVIKPKEGVYVYRGVSYTFQKMNTKSLYETNSNKKNTEFRTPPSKERSFGADESQTVFSYRTDLKWLIEEAERQAIGDVEKEPAVA